MRQKVGIAIAMAKRRQGAAARRADVRPRSQRRQRVLAAAARASDEGVAVLTTTHDLFHAKQTGTRIGIMKRGRLVADLSSERLSHADLEALYLQHMQGMTMIRLIAGARSSRARARRPTARGPAASWWRC